MPPRIMWMELILELPPPADEIHQMKEQLKLYWPETRMKMSRIGPVISSTNSNTKYCFV